jgi:uncharacterized protein GlcG (DUF336 family)
MSQDQTESATEGQKYFERKEMYVASEGLPTFERLRAALKEAQQSNNGGLGFHMWGTVVDRNGVAVAIAYTGDRLGDQWPGSRVISAQKANAANALSLSTLALSTANLYSAVQPGGTLFGLEETNPINTETVYGGDPKEYGTPRDYLIGRPPGGINVFGGGVALYAADGTIVGGLGVSGDYSCADHNIAWKLRHLLELDYVPSGVDPVVIPGKPNDDNIVYDIDPKTGKSASGWGHPECPGTTKEISLTLPTQYPIRFKGAASSFPQR